MSPNRAFGQPRPVKAVLQALTGSRTEARTNEKLPPEARLQDVIMRFSYDFIHMRGCSSNPSSCSAYRSIVIPKSFQKHSKTIPKSCPNHTQIIPKSFQNHTNIIPKSFQNHTNIILKLSQKASQPDALAYICFVLSQFRGAKT